MTYQYQVSKLTTGLVIAHIIVSILVIAFYARVAVLKKQKLVQKYKNIVLWAVSGLVCALILLDMAKKPDLSAIGGNVPGENTLIVKDASPVVLTLFIATIVHLVVSIVLAIPFFYDMIISILPTKSYKNQILWCVSFVVCLIMGGAVAKLLKDEDNTGAPAGAPAGPSPAPAGPAPAPAGPAPAPAGPAPAPAGPAPTPAGPSK